jgi:hypothetical protein
MINETNINANLNERISSMSKRIDFSAAGLYDFNSTIVIFSSVSTAAKAFFYDRFGSGAVSVTVNKSASGGLLFALESAGLILG